MIPQSESLLKFENPVLISTGKDKKGASKTIRKVCAAGLKSMLIAARLLANHVYAFRARFHLWSKGLELLRLKTS
jgi:hypothetical protein